MELSSALGITLLFFKNAIKCLLTSPHILRVHMTPDQIQQLDQRLSEWRANHTDAESLRAAYRQQVLKFTLSSMALENEPVNPERLAKLLSSE